MRLLAFAFATAAAVAIAISQITPVQAQRSENQSGASARQPAAGQARGSEGATTRGSNSRGASVGERSESSGRSAGVRSERSQTSVGIRSKTNETTIGGRSQTRIGLSSGGREDIILKRKRAHGVIAFNDEPRRRVVIKRRHPDFVISETSRTARSRLGGEADVRVGIRSHETTGSSTKINRSESLSSSSSRSSRGGQPGGQARGTAGGRSGGNAGTTGSGGNAGATGPGSNR